MRGKSGGYGIGPGTGKGEKTRRYYTLKAAQEGLAAGYNYAFMSPLKIGQRADYRTVVRYGGGTARREQQ